MVDLNLKWAKRGARASEWGIWIGLGGSVITAMAFGLAAWAFLLDQDVRRSTLVTNAWTLLIPNLNANTNRGQSEAASVLLNNGISLSGLAAKNTNLRNMRIDSINGGATFAKSDLCGADLSGSNLSNADFTRDIFGKHASLTHVKSDGASFSWSFLKNSFLSGSIFINGLFYRADLRGAFADAVDFRGAKFNYADMREMSFSSITFSEGKTIHSKSTDVSGATFYGADLRGTDLSELVGLTTEALEGACLDENPKLPPSVKPPEHCVLEVPKGSVSTKHIVAFLRPDGAQDYLQQARACGLDANDLPAAMRAENPAFKIRAPGE
jgi:uncharacterized protein YjbI with pentapeptide repeats